MLSLTGIHHFNFNMETNWTQDADLITERRFVKWFLAFVRFKSVVSDSAGIEQSASSRITGVNKNLRMEGSETTRINVLVVRGAITATYSLLRSSIMEKWVCCLLRVVSDLEYFDSHCRRAPAG